MHFTLYPTNYSLHTTRQKYLSTEITRPNLSLYNIPQSVFSQVQSKISPQIHLFPNLVQDSLLSIQDILGVIQSLPRVEPGRLGWTLPSRVNPIRSCPAWPVWCQGKWTSTQIYSEPGRNVCLVLVPGGLYTIQLRLYNIHYALYSWHCAMYTRHYVH